MRNYYEAYDQRYQQVHARGLEWFGGHHTPIVAQMLEKYGDGVSTPVLEIGCGEGNDAAHLLDPKLCARCKLRFLVTEVLEGMENIPSKSQRLAMLSQYGFVTCKYLVSNRPLNIRQMEQGLHILHFSNPRERQP